MSVWSIVNPISTFTYLKCQFELFKIIMTQLQTVVLTAGLTIITVIKYPNFFSFSFSWIVLLFYSTIKGKIKTGLNNFHVVFH